MKIQWSKGVIFVLAITTLIAVRFVFFRAPSESQMIAKFHAHKAEFEQIRLMLVADKFLLDRPRTQQEIFKGQLPNGVGEKAFPEGLTKERVMSYRSRVKALGMRSMYVDQFKNRVRFYSFGGGFTDTSWSVGYAWTSDEPPNLVRSAYNQPPGLSGLYFSNIEDHWYIYRVR